MNSPSQPPDDPAETVTSVPTPAAGAAQGFGPYLFRQRLGEGGMGEVWLAEQLRPLRRQVAVKIVKTGMETVQVVARFETERQALAVMDHPAIAKVFDGGTTPDGRPYFAMEYVRGEPITSYCDRLRLTLRQRIELFIDLCEGVQHAHQKGIIHRDLKPSNVLVAESDGRHLPRIIDFGIAKAITQPLTDRPFLTEIGGLLGTPEYMSPEQADLAPADVDTRSDVYALGVILYELLAGALPFDSAELRRAGIEVLRRTLREQEPALVSARTASRDPAARTAAAEGRGMSPAKLTAALRGDLDWIAMKALAKERSRRYQTVNALALDLRRHLNHEPVSAGPPLAVYRARKFVRRHQLGVGIAAMVALFVLVLAAVSMVQARRIARERDRANQEAIGARQVSDFLVGLFKVSDPGEARGNTLTAREILARGATQLDVSLLSQPQVQARLQSTIGQVYTGLGMYAEAVPLLERSLQTQERVLGTDSFESLTTKNDLANLYWYLQRYEAAERLYQEVVQRRSRLLGDDHADTLRANFDLASVYLRQRRLEEFEALAQKTLSGQRRALGDTHPDTLASLNNLQVFYYRAQRYQDAEAVATQVLDQLRRVSGNDAPETLRAIHNLATVYDALGRYDRAEPLYLEAIAGRRRVLGNDHPDTSVTLAAMAGMYLAQGKLKPAETAAIEAYEGFAKRLGREHPDAQDAVRRLMKLYESSGRPDLVREWRARLAPATVKAAQR